jgi:hypothetical protein
MSWLPHIFHRGAATPPNRGMLESPGERPPHDDGLGAANAAGADAAEMAADLTATVNGLPSAWGSWTKQSIKRALARLRQSQRLELGVAPCRCAQGCVCNLDVASVNEKEVHTPQAAAAASTASGEASLPRPPPAPPPKPQKRPSTEVGGS